VPDHAKGFGVQCVSNCTWENGEVITSFRQPFDLLAETTVIAAQACAMDGAI
jgi:hypothetical protein